MPLGPPCLPTGWASAAASACLPQPAPGLSDLNRATSWTPWSLLGLDMGSEPQRP